MTIKKPYGLIAGLIVIVAVVAGLGMSSHNNASTKGKIEIVAGENFWGSLASQLGGSRAHVTSIVSDPNADPHEYESNTTTARQFSSAKYVILNGAGYDSWADKLLAASSPPDRKVLRVSDLLGKKDGDNPHFWYDPAYVNQVVAHMDSDLIAVDPSGASYYKQQLKNLQASLATYQNHINEIKQRFAGTKVAATEDIFVYLADASGLDLVSPPAFIEAVAEGNDPPTASVVTFQQQVESGQIKVLVYNQQTITPLTENVKKMATQHGIPIVGITETLQPPNAKFQDWMNSELTTLENALNGQAG